MSNFLPGETVITRRQVTVDPPIPAGVMARIIDNSYDLGGRLPQYYSVEFNNGRGFSTILGDAFRRLTPLEQLALVG